MQEHTASGETTVSADIIAFPTASPLHQAVAGCMGACWLICEGGPVDIEAISRLYRHLEVRRPGRRDAGRLLRQMLAATEWLEAAHRQAVFVASQDGETTGEDGDAAASRAIDLVGALGLLAMCCDSLRPSFARMTDKEIHDAWQGLELDFG